MENKKEIIAAKRGYIVTEEGVLLNPKGNEVGVIINGYHTLKMRFSGKSLNLKTHRLQAFQKYGSKIYEEGIVVRHKNGISEDNSWDNILIGTHSDNMMDIPEQIRIKKARYATSFIRKYNKKEVREFHKKENSYKLTMQKFGISSKGTLNYILKSYK